MEIVIYNSTFSGFINNYNISCLIDAHPEHNYYIVSVKEPDFRRSWFRNIISELKNGKNHFVRDTKEIENRIFSICPKINWDNYKSWQVNAVNDEESEKIIREINPDIIIQADAGILKENIFRLAKLATLNVHHGYAPHVRGMNSTFWALYYGLTDMIGVTCHFVDKTLDTGTVVKQYLYSYNEGDDYIDIQMDIIKNGAILLQDSIKILQGEYSVSSEEVASYYFSSVDYKDYNALRANKFKALGDYKELKTKIKLKTKVANHFCQV